MAIDIIIISFPAIFIPCSHCSIHASIHGTLHAAIGNGILHFYVVLNSPFNFPIIANSSIPLLSCLLPLLPS